MLADPLVIAAAAPTPAIDLAIVKHDGYGSERVDDNGAAYGSVINHETLKDGYRHYVKVTFAKDITNPYTGVIQKKYLTASLTVNAPIGFTDAEKTAQYELLDDVLRAATLAKIWQRQA